MFSPADPSACQPRTVLGNSGSPASSSIIAPIPFFEADDNLPLAATILIVDSEEINRRLLKAIFKTTPYKFLEAHRASEATAILQSEKIDLVILDLMLPEMSGPELCRWMKARRSTQLVPVLMITNLQGVENEIVGISSGADEFLIKPLHPAVVRTRVRAMLRNKSLIDSLEEAETILLALAQTVEHRDQHTGKHCQRLAVASVMLGEALGLASQDLTALYRGGYLHDIGKIAIPDSILFKQGGSAPMNGKSCGAIPRAAKRFAVPMRSLAPVLPIIRSHHERWDGSGYPDGLAGEDIPLLARILQVADIYDALTTERPYKPALTPEEAFAVMEEEVRRGWRDPELVSPVCQHRFKPTPMRTSRRWKHHSRTCASPFPGNSAPLTVDYPFSLQALEILAARDCYLREVPAAGGVSSRSGTHQAPRLSRLGLLGEAGARLWRSLAPVCFLSDSRPEPTAPIARGACSPATARAIFFTRFCLPPALPRNPPALPETTG